MSEKKCLRLALHLARTVVRVPVALPIGETLHYQSANADFPAIVREWVKGKHPWVPFIQRQALTVVGFLTILNHAVFWNHSCQAFFHAGSSTNIGDDNSISSVTPSPSPAPPLVAGSHPCDICGKIFPYRYQMIVHRRYHTERKPFTCQVR